jgi:ribonuclease-3
VTDSFSDPGLGRALGVSFRDPEIVRVSLTHRSYAFENGLTETNERLEFLGDAVLGLIVTDVTFRAFPEMPEGELAKLRAATVNMNTLADVARELHLGDLVLLGKGEEMSGGRDKPSILADAMEAVLGAVFVDGGIEVSYECISRLFLPRIHSYVRGEGGRDYKTSLQELASQGIGSLPAYKITERGPDHEKRFTATVHLAGKAWGSGEGRSKKEAEQEAAHEAFDALSSRASRADRETAAKG